MKKIIFLLLLLVSITTSAQTIVDRLEVNVRGDWGKERTLLLKMNNSQVFAIEVDDYKREDLDKFQIGAKVSIKENWFDWELKIGETEVDAESYSLNDGSWETFIDDHRGYKKTVVQGVIIDEESAKAYINLQGRWYRFSIKNDPSMMWVLFLKKGDNVFCSVYMGLDYYHVYMKDICLVNEFDNEYCSNVSWDYVKQFVVNKK